MKKTSGLIALILALSLPLFSQNEIEALRYSRNFPTGTGRAASMGGAFGALGGDLTSLGTNPAGIGLYRRSEISFTPNLFINTTASSHYGNESFGNKSNFNLGNGGIVLTFNTGNETGWISSAIGFGYNRVNNFNSRISLEGVNAKSSLLDMYKRQIESNEYNPFGSELAWNTYLVDTFNGTYYTAIPNYGERQSKTIHRSGSVGETVFSFGGNYNNRLYLGGAVGFSRIRFKETSTYKETTDPKDTITMLSSFSQNEDLSTNGSGINFKAGAIFRANDFVRIGGAIHSPTYYDLTDNWNAGIEANFKDTTFKVNSVDGLNDYSIVTPFKAIGSVAFLFGKSGLISLDYEFLDYSMAWLSGLGANTYNYSEENKQIGSKYKSAGNLRVGTEWIIHPFSLRAGVVNYGNPFSKGVGNTAQANSYSAGFGIREDGYFIDFAYVLTTMSENYYLYDPVIVQPTVIDQTSQSFLVTLGVKF